MQKRWKNSIGQAASKVNWEGMVEYIYSRIAAEGNKVLFILCRKYEDKMKDAV